MLPPFETGRVAREGRGGINAVKKIISFLTTGTKKRVVNE